VHAADAQPELAVDAGAGSVTLRGRLTLARVAELYGGATAAAAALRPQPCTVDARALDAMDTAGAVLLLDVLARTGVPLDGHRIEGMRDTDAALVRLVAARFDAARPEARRRPGVADALAYVGGNVVAYAQVTREMLGFVGLTLVELGRLLLGRRRLRLTSTVYHMQEVGLDAVPIVALLTFLVGAVVAFIGASALRDLGAEVFTVELVSVSYLREFGVLLTAILLAGRSGSAFAAQIGSMKSREELDAIQALGLDAIELLVLPRLLALLVMLPLLTFVADVMGILGGGIVGTLALDITPAMFVSRLLDETDIAHFWVGMVKAPVFAFLIAVVGCLEGFKVEGSAESVGQHTTAAVVQSIFLVIVFDALFAMVFMELDI
jgi:phospholipid/cholesterol/gamma-HCH transport system permease protein